MCCCRRCVSAAFYRIDRDNKLPVFNDGERYLYSFEDPNL